MINLRQHSVAASPISERGESLTRESVAAEPCKCVRCVMCSGTGRIPIDHWSGYDTEPCEDCDNGIVEACGRCEFLADWDREAPYDWNGQAEL